MSGQASAQTADLLKEGQAALDRGDFEHAIQDFERVRQSAPQNLQANRGLLLSYLQAGRLNDAEQLGREAVAQVPAEPHLQHWLGLVYFKSQPDGAALQALRCAEQLDGPRFEVPFDLALVLLDQNQYSPAAEELEKANKLNPTDALAHVLLGRAYQNTNRTVQAIEQFHAALRLDPTVPLGHYHLGFAYASLGRNQDAIAEYEKELKRSPDNPNVLYQLGHSLLEAGDEKSAIADLKKATEFEPQNADAFYDLGKALLLVGNTEGAVSALQRSIELKPTDPSPHYQLARALEKMGQRDQAQVEWHRFAQLKQAQPQTGGMATGRVQ